MRSDCMALIFRISLFLLLLVPFRATVQYSTIQYSTVQYITAQYGTFALSAGYKYTPPYSTVRCTSDTMDPTYRPAIVHTVRAINK